MQTISGGKQTNRTTEGFDQNYLAIKDAQTTNSKQSAIGFRNSLSHNLGGANMAQPMFKGGIHTITGNTTGESIKLRI